MIETHQMAMERLVGYASPKAKLTRMVAGGELIRIRRGLYIDDNTIPRNALAPVIYGPSYISFHTALAHYGLIPERVETVDSASYGKNRDKNYRTPVGEFRYLYIPPAAYPYGLTLTEEDGYSYLIASKEKALCDSVYKAGIIDSTSEIRELLIENWRMEESELLLMDLSCIRFLATRYGKKSLATCALWFEKELHA